MKTTSHRQASHLSGRLLAPLASATLAAIALSAFSCARKTAPPLKDITILLIDESPFPPGWEMDPEGPSPVHQGQAPLGGGIGALETTEIRFYLLVEGGSASAEEQIYNLGNAREAEGEFDLKLIHWFPVGPYDTEWTQPGGNPYESHSAQRFYYACSNQGSIPVCQMIAQYGDYLVRFDASLVAYDINLSPIQAMTTSQFEAIIAAVDERIATSLQTQMY